MNVEGHSVVKFENYLYVFGGFDLETKKETNALYRLDITDIERGLAHHAAAVDVVGAPVIAPSPAGKAPSVAGREFMHMMPLQAPTVDAAGGGSSTAAAPFWRPQSSSALSEDVHMYSVATTGVPPSPRAHHACSLRGPYMVVWGGSVGTSQDEGLLGAPTSSTSSVSMAQGITQLFALNLETMAWSTYMVASIAPHVKQQCVPQQRCHATMVCAEDALLLYGGYPTALQQGEENLGFAPNEWRVFRVSGDGLCDAQEPAGASPALWGHSTVYAHRCVLAFGGIDAHSNEEVGSLCVYHVDERRWRWAEFPEGPCARALHSAVLDTSQSAMVVYGGFSSSVGDDDHDAQYDGGRHSGRNPIVSQLQDVWSFSLETGLWEKLFPSAIGAASRAAADLSATPAAAWSPPGRSGHAAAYHNHRMYVIGGLVEKDPRSDAPPQQRGTSSSWGFLQGGGGSGGVSGPGGRGHNSGSSLLIFDLHSRRWRVKNIILAKSSVAASTPNSAQHTNEKGSTSRSIVAHDDNGGVEQTRRESIIDKYLNIASPTQDPSSPASTSRSLRNHHGGSSSEPRTVGSARAAFHQGAAPNIIKSNPIGSPASMQQALVTSVLHEAAADQKRRQRGGGAADGGGLTTSPSRWADDNAAARRSPSHGTNDFAEALMSGDHYTSPLSAQRSLTNEVLHSYRTPPRPNPASPLLAPTSASPPAAAVPFTRMHTMVSSIAEQQSAADLRWTAAENERRSKLLMQYLTTHGDPSTSPWATMTSASGLQDDETADHSAHLRLKSSSPAHAYDPRMIVSPASLLASDEARERRHGSNSAQRQIQSVSPSHLTPATRQQHHPGRLPVSSATPLRQGLDDDEVFPSPVANTVQPHPLAPGPWQQ